MASLKLAAHETEIIGPSNAPAGGVYKGVVLAQQSKLVLDGVELVLNDITLERLGPRTVDLINGATVRIGELAFASIGASVLYRIGPGCMLVMDANLSEPEVVAMTTVEFASGGTGRLRYAPFSNPMWQKSPRVVGHVDGDVLEHINGTMLAVENGRLVVPLPVGKATPAAPGQGSRRPL